MSKSKKGEIGLDADFEDTEQRMEDIASGKVKLGLEGVEGLEEPKSRKSTRGRGGKRVMPGEEAGAGDLTKYSLDDIEEEEDEDEVHAPEYEDEEELEEEEDEVEDKRTPFQREVDEMVEGMKKGAYKDDIDEEEDEEEDDLPPPKGTKKKLKLEEEEEEEEEDEPVKTVKKGVDKKKTPEEVLEAKVKEAIGDEVIEMLGEDFVFKSKGSEFNLQDMDKKELATHIQKGLRFNQRMTELAKWEQEKRDEIEEQERIVEEGAKMVNESLASLRSRPLPELDSISEKPPRELKIRDEDDEDTVAIKELALEQHKQLVSIKKANDPKILERQANEQKEFESKIVSEVQNQSGDFPLGSPEAVMFVKMALPKTSVSELMSKSHNYYGSVDFVEKVFKTCPEVKRHFENKIVSAYIKYAKSKGKTIPLKRSSRMVPTKKAKKKHPLAHQEGYDFDFAGKLAKRAIRERSRLSRVAEEE